MVKIGNRIEKTNPSSPKETIQKPSASFTTEKPKYSFDDIILNEETKEELLNVLSYQKNSEVVFEEWGLNNTHKFSKKIGINLYGDPGTGKTMAAHAIAHKLQRDLMVVNYADIESKYVGETAKNLVHIFQVAKETNSILFFDEADAMLSRRVTNMSNSTDVSVNQTRSVLLMLLNDHQDIILFATNFISNFDPAFMRRILAHIHFSLPDAEQRENLWRKLIPRELPQSLDLTEMATEYPGVTGSDISNAILNAAFAAARKNESHVSDKYFKDSILNILKSKRHNHQQNIKTTDRIVDEKYVKTQLQK
ncbi:ATP-dependent zinc metalloprotease FtsH 3 [Bacillus mobilis]|uniref:ATP-dependent zinc metalloprotease FtsH 3 n=1 Tax=Bacillus mobilis TaxID=2026190 RepID=A0A1Y5ZBS5_9BACI|nr:ATP-binding protein [Bacillus mobilis]SMD90127.1 ATP-dependent zinc metalloprotease FtsH 3 [Bacillus mobilis]